MGQTIKVSAAAAVAILPFHKDVFAICRVGVNAQQTLRAKLAQLLTTRYGAPVIGKDSEGKETRSGGPSFEQYRADSAALRQLAADAKPVKGADVGQYMRKAYAHAIYSLYGALPVSQDAAAVAKRAQREAAAAVKAAQAPAAPVGAPAGETQEKPVSEGEQIEQIVTRLGLIKTMDACIRILSADDSTKPQATHFRKMLDKLIKDAAKLETVAA